ncbi:mitochondrial fusion and transport protein ugo1 [Toensbergia leucococca]|nr:mitochondrial fusion and transport protein ugo1 [Toensbergia leucococca]
MSNPQEGLNPLRPYYIPPSLGLPSDSNINTSHAHSVGSRHTFPLAAANPSLGTSARNILSDLDYSDYLSDSSPSALEVIKRLIDQATWRYTSVFLAQPFEVAKTVLQVQVANSGHRAKEQAASAEDMRRRPGRYRDEVYEVCAKKAFHTFGPTNAPNQLPSDDSDPDSPSYFTSAAPLSHTPSRSPRPRRRYQHSHSRSDSFAATPPLTSHTSSHTLNITSPSALIAVVSSLWTSEGSWGIWKGTNSTYIHSILLSTLTSFVRSLLSALLALPDPGSSFLVAPPAYSTIGGLDVSSSSSPVASLLVAVSAAGIAGIVLAPVDIARTKLILTPSTHPPRSLISTLKSLPSWTLPFSIAPVAILHSTLPTLIYGSTPLLLRSRMGIDPVLTPALYAIATFLGQVVELGLRLPLETVLRRGQINAVKSTSRGNELQTVVEVGSYRGLMGTMYSIIWEEGERGRRAEIVRASGGAPAQKIGNEGRRKKGQGLEGLYRGWRVGMWGLLGVWGAATLGGAGGKGGEF